MTRWLTALSVFTVIGSAFAAEDREYCGLSYLADNFHPSPVAYSHVFPTTHLEASSGRAHLILFQSATGDVKLSRTYATGLPGEQEIDVAVSPDNRFCRFGSLFSADLNGDSRDDLLCHNMDNSFSVRDYIPHDRYKPERPLDASVTCSGTVMIGDFDGNGADDIMCIDTTSSATITPTSYIYFSSSCQKFDGFHRDHKPYQASKTAHRRDHRCDRGLPRKRVFKNGELPGFDPMVDAAVAVVADVNGDGLDDILFPDVNFASPHALTHFLSKGSAASGSVFGDTAFVAQTPPVCDTTTTNSLEAADVDGDGDDDAICLNKKPDVSTEQEISYYNDGEYGAFVPPAAAPCGGLCSDGAATIDVEYSFADFNGDGFVDYMCRWNDAVTVFTRFYYSVPKATP